MEPPQAGRTAKNWPNRQELGPAAQRAGCSTAKPTPGDTVGANPGLGSRLMASTHTSRLRLGAQQVRSRLGKPVPAESWLAA